MKIDERNIRKKDENRWKKLTKKMRIDERFYEKKMKIDKRNLWKTDKRNIQSPQVK